jgi:peptidoglycan/LPS O-acetylase OafA/YrhL
MNAISPTLKHSRFWTLDVLRGLGILVIMVYHCLPVTYLAIDRLPMWIDWVKFGGKLGVSLFFVLSGFSIHYSQLWSSQNVESDRSQWRSFFQRRWGRLYPSYLAAIILALGLSFAWSLVRDRSLTLPSIKNILTHLFLIHTLFSDTFFGIIPALWFIGVQAHLYLLYPLFWAWIRHWQIERALFIVLALTLLSRLLSKTIASSSAPESLAAVIWMNAPQRWFEWCFGAWVGHQVVQNQWLPFSLTIVVGLLGVIWSIWGDTFPVLDEPVLGGLIGLIIWGLLSLKNQPKLSKFWHSFITLGSISYPLYLTHQIFIPYARSALDQLSIPLLFQTLLLFSIVLGITIPVSILFNRQLERSNFQK